MVGTCTASYSAILLHEIHYHIELPSSLYFEHITTNARKRVYKRKWKKSPQQYEILVLHTIHKYIIRCIKSSPDCIIYNSPQSC